MDALQGRARRRRDLPAVPDAELVCLPRAPPEALGAGDRRAGTRPPRHAEPHRLIVATAAPQGSPYTRVAAGPYCSTFKSRSRYQAAAGGGAEAMMASTSSAASVRRATSSAA